MINNVKETLFTCQHHACIDLNTFSHLFCIIKAQPCHVYVRHLSPQKSRVAALMLCPSLTCVELLLVCPTPMKSCDNEIGYFCGLSLFLYVFDRHLSSFMQERKMGEKHNYFLVMSLKAIL